jgi:2,4-dienoyl-CoA reductase-like NADH-dependent reductase (Old Yellow Enzyme family)
LYGDQFIPGLADCIEQIHKAGSYAFVHVDQPLDMASRSDGDLQELSRAWIAAAQRASSAGADGVMLSCVDGGPFHYLLSPLTNRREGAFGGVLERRNRLLLETVEKLHARFSSRMVVGLRLLVDEFTPGGVTIQDARVVARRLTVAGVRLIEAYAPTTGTSPMAHFPGWRTPLAMAIRAVVDVPVMVGDLNADPEFTDSVLAERSADLVALGEILHENPTWPREARAALGLE